MSADIVYLHPSKHAASFKDYVKAGGASPYMLTPVGLPGMINLLRQNGFQVTGLDVPLEILIDQQFDLESWLKERPDIRLIAIDLHWYEHSFGALDVAQVCKKIYPNTPVVLGGLTASYFSQEIMRDFPQVDFIIRGDAEKPLLDLAQWVCGADEVSLESIPNLVYRKEVQVISNQLTYCAAQADLDGLNFVDMDFLIHADKLAEVVYNLSEKVEMSGEVSLKGHWLTIGRGCIYNCSFCGGGYSAHKTIANRQGIIPRSPTCVVDDLEHLQRLGYQQVALNLDPAIMGKEYWLQLFTEMRQRQVKVGLYIELFQLPGAEFFEELVASVDITHSELAISPLSGSERVRRVNGKHFSNSQLMNILHQLQPSGMAIFIYFSLNIPFEDAKTFQHTLRLAKEIGEFYPAKSLRMINMIHTVDPSSPLSRQPQKFGQKVKFKSFRDYYSYCQETPVLRQDVKLSDWRGFQPAERVPHALESMAAQWDALSARQTARYYPVPRTW